MAKKGTTKVKKISNDKSPVRTLPKPAYRSFRLSKRINPHSKQLPKARHLLKASLSHLWRNKKVFLGITGVYLLGTVLLVKGLQNTTELELIKEDIEGVLTGTTGQLATGFALYGLLLGNISAASSETASTYQAILLVLVSLALIWALRQTHSAKKIGVREAFYKGMYPLVPFVAVLLVIGLQSIPLAIGNWLFGVTVVAGLAVTPVEQWLWGIFCFLLALLTVYMVCSSLFALYVSTLPDMTPLKALRSTRELVRYRRWEIIRKVLFLPLVLLIVTALIMVPAILFLTPLAEWLFFVLSMALLAVTHSYLYSLYRELL